METTKVIYLHITLIYIFYFSFGQEYSTVWCHISFKQLDPESKGVFFFKFSMIIAMSTMQDKERLKSLKSFLKVAKH